MLPVTLYNSRTRQKDHLVPIDPQNIRMYVCGPTVYDSAHIGNARPVVVFDCLYRLLRQSYGVQHVTYARNITDVDDKINQRALEEGISIAKLTKRTTADFHADIDALNALRPTVEPRATHHIEDMISMIQSLIEKGHAYEAEGHVLFHVPSLKTYGALSGRSMDEMMAGARVEVAPYKKDPMDFVLWKPSPPDLPGWDSPWPLNKGDKKGRGRPGWHIECSAMALSHLGEQFDIHGGGIDLMFPHHENEIAQSCCATGRETMANIWMHNGYLQVEGEKMSKSLGNFITVKDLLKDWRGESIRLAMLSTHYRQPINWTVQGLKEADKTLNQWYEVIADLEATEFDFGASGIGGALCDDLNTPKAIAHLHQLKNKAQGGDTMAAQALKNESQLLGLLTVGQTTWADSKPQKFEVDETYIKEQIEKRLAARQDKDWALADQIRDELLEKNIILKDGAEGTDWSLKD